MVVQLISKHQQEKYSLGKQLKFNKLKPIRIKTETKQIKWHSTN